MSSGDGPEEQWERQAHREHVETEAAEGVWEARAEACGNCNPCSSCDLSLLRLSTLLFLAAAVAPPRGADRLAAAAVRGYRRWLTRYTPRCPGTPSCSASALASLERLGARRGLSAAAARIRDCGTRRAAATRPCVPAAGVVR